MKRHLGGRGFRSFPSRISLTVNLFLITVGFGSSEQLLSCGFSFRYNSDGGGYWRREKERKVEGNHA
jgi:hypothetical protein